MGGALLRLSRYLYALVGRQNISNKSTICKTIDAHCVHAGDMIFGIIQSALENDESVFIQEYFGYLTFCGAVV
jgi:hypothetical protein